MAANPLRCNRNRMTENKEGIFISKKGETQFEGSLNFEETTEILRCISEIQSQLTDHLIKQYGAFGVACAERGAAQAIHYADEDGAIEKEKIVEAVEEVYKRLNASTEDDKEASNKNSK